MLVQAAYFVNFFMFKVARARSHCAGGGEMLLKGMLPGGVPMQVEKNTLINIASASLLLF